MASQSLYRKWRSQTFSDLIGQEAVSRTLLNAVREGRLAHAYLFCGPRGTGKTSVARLLAKAINCTNPQNGEPCNECVSCLEIASGRSPDVIEIDAASNNGIENIRDIREKSNLLGSGGHYKVYVVDECFSYEELVTLADGSQQPIGKLVEAQWPGEVLSYNTQTGAIEPKPIVRHMKKPATVPTVKITFDNNRSIVCTINHKFYTPQGQICAGHLEIGQFVYTNRERITQHQRMVIMGAALGDGNLGLTGSAMRGRLRLVHGVAQREYLDYKVRLLGDLVGSPARYQSGVGTYSKTGTYRISTLSRPEIAQIHRELYGVEGRKHISRAYLDQLNELGLALWYLDDGSLVTTKYRYARVRDGGLSTYPVARSVFSMYGFTVDDVREVCAWFQECWGIESKFSITARGPVIWLTLAGTARLHALIARYAPPVMQYKLLPEYRGQFEGTATDDGVQSGLAVSVVKAITPVPLPEFVYNIEVADNHNYFVRDMLVANCHMLSISAFNAFLKTLEEPPPHVIFVLATTEAHKVLPTVVSRCQRFDFRRIGMRDIVARLEHVARGEGLELEPAAAELLARSAQGGLRDALSLLDQAVAFCGARIDIERTRTMLGLADVTALRRLIACVADDRPADGLEIINELVTTGADLRQLNSQLAEEWRALMLARAGGDLTRLMEYTAEEARDLAALAERFTLEQLMASARVFTRNEGPARGLPVPQLALELSFLECVSFRRGVTPSVSAPAQAAPSAQAAPPPRPLPRPATLSPAPSPASSPAPRMQPARAAEELDLAAIDAGTWTGPAAPAVPASQPAAAMDFAPTEDDEPVAPRAGAHLAGHDDQNWVEEARRQWSLIRKVCKQKTGLGSTVYGLLNDVEPLRLEPGSPPTLIMAARHDFHLKSLREDPKREIVEWALEQALGAPFRARFVAAGEAQPGMAAVPTRRSPAPSRTVDPAPSSPVRENSGAYRAAPPPAPSRAAVSGHASRPAAPTAARPSAPPTPSASATSPEGIDQAARQDPVVLEFVRHGLEIAEVRPLDPADGGSERER